MPLTIKTKPSLIRKLKRDRTEIRKWAKGRSEAVQARVAMYCQNLRELEKTPLRLDLRMQAAKNLADLKAMAKEEEG